MEQEKKVRTRDKVLELFEKNKGKYYSGEELAEKLSVSRAAVWKAVNSLRNDGYDIDAVTNRGYCMSAQTDILSPQGIRKYLAEELCHTEIDVVATIDSTNAKVKEAANKGVTEGYLLVSGSQTKGRGRYGRHFYSPEESGVYMSILLRPYNCPAGKAACITTMAAVAVCEAIEEVSGQEAQIKWVNDIFVKGKKVCGILTEASIGVENGMVEYAVLGIGINIYAPNNGFPEDISHIAGAVFDNKKEEAKNRITALVYNRFMNYYKDNTQIDYVEEYRKRSFVIGNNIMVLSGNKTRKAYAYGIDDECHLLVRYENGEEECLAYGEISVRMC